MPSSPVARFGMGGIRVGWDVSCRLRVQEEFGSTALYLIYPHRHMQLSGPEVCSEGHRIEKGFTGARFVAGLSA